MGTTVGKAACPRCQAKGNDRAGDNLALYDDGSSFCFACGYFEGNGKRQHNTQDNEGTFVIMPEFNLESLMKARGITLATLKRYGVTLKRGELAVYVCFPVYDAANALVGEQRRTVDTTQGKLTKEMSMSKGTKLTNPLFGSNLIRKNTKTVLVCEGQMDALAAATNIKSKDTVALGVVGAMAAKKAAAQLLRYSDNLSIVLAFDNDEAGEEGKTAFVKYIREHKPGRQLLDLGVPKGYNDVNDWLLAEQVNLDEEIANASVVMSADIIGSREISERLGDYVRKLKTNSYIQLKFSPTLSKTVRLMPGKLVGIIGDSGKGKSTLVEHMLLESMAQGFNCFFVSAEMKAEEVGLKMARTSRGIDYYSELVLKDMSEDDIDDLQAFTERLTNKLNMFARFGQCGIAEISDRLFELEVAGRKPDLVAIDHMLAIAGEGSTEELETIAKSLKALAETHECCIVLLAHTRKPPQSKSARTIYRPQLSDVYNSGGLSRYADIVLGVALDKPKSTTLVETVKLERMGGGYADVSLKLVDWQLVETIDNPVTDAKMRTEFDSPLALELSDETDDDFDEEEFF